MKNTPKVTGFVGSGNRPVLLSQDEAFERGESARIIDGPRELRRTMVARPDVTGILPPGLCDLVNEHPTGRPFSVTGRLFESLGDWDFTAQAGASRDWVGAFKNARLLVFEESGHLPFAEQPTEFTRAVDTFLKGAWPQQAETAR